jgi:hypothetical protein
VFAKAIKHSLLACAGCFLGALGARFMSFSHAPTIAPSIRWGTIREPPLLAICGKRGYLALAHGMNRAMHPGPLSYRYPARYPNDRKCVANVVYDIDLVCVSAAIPIAATPSEAMNGNGIRISRPGQSDSRHGQRLG